ncbi:STN and carboxypeptidase regulatory-like domain-containing protein [Chitinophaga sancti]|uniref:STN and carboxypeptidase regulatory-like domain-containing protein n=1 Tax=Chitinophaga sancti TaxID=1004 RepID=UPI0015A715F0|nr:STN and carboxypeptidase regulatory-like domain-containing protein [Chitinophaga sancti]WQD63409.1 STN and carboxypeptidase regulatory-like domain-containing protein [Chitinophaga sancti]
MLRQLFLFVVLLCALTCSYAQGNLSKTVSISMTRQPMSAVLDAIAHQGDFHFSYVREMVHADSLVSVRAGNKTVKQVLDQLFQGSMAYRDAGNQVLLQPNREKYFFVSGHVTDGSTGQPLHNASVYEGVQLISTMTNDQGYYRLRLRERDKDRPMPVMLTVSKELYKDTIMLVSGGYDQEISVSIKPAPPITLGIVDVNQYSRVSESWFGKVFLTSKQRYQSLNLSKFFADQPYQTSFLPGLGTHGKLSSQVVNKVSLNFIGGYSAGLNGVEISGAFNIDQRDVQYAQFASLFNVVGGKMHGVQLSGLHNQVRDSVKGLQASGFSNMTTKGYEGVQLAGIFNVSTGETRGLGAAGVVNVYWKDHHGLMAAGIGNMTRAREHGVQAAGVFNVAQQTNVAQLAGVINLADTASGLQVAGVVNAVRVLKGVQVGVFNYADSSDGYSIGVISIVRRGYHQLLVYNTELLPFNLAFKSGNSKLYSLIIAGGSFVEGAKAFSFGYGLGKSFKDYSVELTEQNLYLGNRKSLGTLARLQVAWNREIGKNARIFIGPAFTLYFSEEDSHVEGYKSRVPGPYGAFTFNDHMRCWFGWHVGFSFF